MYRQYICIISLNTGWSGFMNGVCGISIISWDKVCNTFVLGYIMLTTVNCIFFITYSHYYSAYSQSSGFSQQVSWARLKATMWMVRVQHHVWKCVSTGKALQMFCDTPWPPCWEDGHSCGWASPASAWGGHMLVYTPDQMRLGEEKKNINIKR